MTERTIYGVSEFVDYLNQTLGIAYPYVEIEGELSNFRISKNRWVYFDLKDESASVRCFAAVYALPGPLEDGMLVRVAGTPRLHPLYNFSFNAQMIQPVGEGALRRAADLLAAKLEGEGLFDESRKRLLPRVPQKIALITAGDSAAYADFVKIANARWGGLMIEHYNVLVQGEKAPGDIIRALSRANEGTSPAEVIVLIRGGGSADDLAAWSDERVVRAVAASRVPTLVAIGHEVDISLAELAADQRASTPSNAAELLLPDRAAELRHLQSLRQVLNDKLRGIVEDWQAWAAHIYKELDQSLRHNYERACDRVERAADLLAALDPKRPLALGYTLVYQSKKLVRSVSELKVGSRIEVAFTDGIVGSDVKEIRATKEEK